MLGIERNKHPAGRLSNIVFGLCQVGDGLVRLVSLGHLHSRWTLTWAKQEAKRAIMRMKELQ